MKQKKKSVEICQLPHQIHQHSHTLRYILEMPKYSLHLHTRTHLESMLEMLVTNTYLALRKRELISKLL